MLQLLPANFARHPYLDAMSHDRPLARICRITFTYHVAEVPSRCISLAIPETLTSGIYVHSMRSYHPARAQSQQVISPEAMVSHRYASPPVFAHARLVFLHRPVLQASSARGSLTRHVSTFCSTMSSGAAAASESAAARMLPVTAMMTKIFMMLWVVFWVE